MFWVWVLSLQQFGEVFCEMSASLLQHWIPPLDSSSEIRGPAASLQLSPHSGWSCWAMLSYNKWMTSRTANQCKASAWRPAKHEMGVCRNREWYSHTKNRALNRPCKSPACIWRISDETTVPQLLYELNRTRINTVLIILGEPQHWLNDWGVIVDSTPTTSTS